MKAAVRLAALLIGLCTGGGGFAQDYPSKPVRVIVPFPPGGLVDISAHLVCQKLTEFWGRSVVVGNHAGGGGVLGIEAAAKSSPDGYTLLAFSDAYAKIPVLNTGLPFDPLKDFVGISPLVSPHSVLIVSASTGIDTLSKLIDKAKATPEQVSSGFSFGPATTSHILSEKFKLATGTAFTHTLKKNPNELTNDILAGRITFSFLSSPHSHIREGKLRALGVTGTRRSNRLPDVPTLAEAGLAGFEHANWTGLWAPSGTPADIVDKIAGDVARALAAPDVREKAGQLDVELMSMTNAEFMRFVNAEIDGAARIVKGLGITPQAAPAGKPIVSHRPCGGSK